MKTKFGSKTVEKLAEEGHLVLVISKDKLEGANRDDVGAAILEELGENIDDIIKEYRPYDFKLGETVIERVEGAMGFYVYVEVSFGTVCISNADGDQEDIFLQGDEGHNFIQEANDLYERCGNISMDNAYTYLALSYVENIWN